MNANLPIRILPAVTRGVSTPRIVGALIKDATT
jgi:hypothetical protein